MKIELTANGLDFLSHCLEGGPSPVFCKIALGNGEDAGSTAKDLSNPLKEMEIASIERNGNMVELTGVLNNADNTDRFYATELGVYITDPENDSESILFAYGHVPENEAAVIPAVTDYAFETIEKVFVYVGKTENVSAIVSESMVTATKAELEEHTLDVSNPHKVTALQVGLGNVENKAFNDQTPTYTEATELTELKSKENVSTAFGKIAKAVKSLIDHLKNKSNPHEVTIEQIKAASSTHYHKASEITSGILGVARGGTGKSSMSELAKALNEYNLQIKSSSYWGTGSRSSTINCGFTPICVFVYCTSGKFSSETEVYGGLATSILNGWVKYSPDDSGYWTDDNLAIMCTNGGFVVYLNEDFGIYTNVKGYDYNYIALGYKEK